MNLQYLHNEKNRVHVCGNVRRNEDEERKGEKEYVLCCTVKPSCKGHLKASITVVSVMYTMLGHSE